MNDYIFNGFELLHCSLYIRIKSLSRLGYATMKGRTSSDYSHDYCTKTSSVSSAHRIQPSGHTLIGHLLSSAPSGRPHHHLSSMEITTAKRSSLHQSSRCTSEREELTSSSRCANTLRLHQTPLNELNFTTKISPLPFVHANRLFHLNLMIFLRWKECDVSVEMIRHSRFVDITFGLF